MLAIAKSMEASTESVSKNTASQTVRNGIMLFVGKTDDSVHAAKEYFALKQKFYLDSDRIEATAAAHAQELDPATMPQSNAFNCGDKELIDDDDE
jgi:hypothetical protein